MKVPNQRRIFKQDFEEQYQKLVDSLALSININFESLFSVVQQRVSLSDNIFCSVRDVQVIVDASGIPVNNTIFTVDSFITSISGLQVINQTNTTNLKNYPTSGVTVTFTQVQTGININHITGLTPGDTWKLRLVVYGQ